MRISLALAAAALCFSTVGCACPRCPYLGYPIPPRMAMLDAPEEFPDAPPARPVKADKAEKTEPAEKSAPQVTARAKKTPAKKTPATQKPASLATRAGLTPAKKQPGSAAKTQVAVAKPAGKAAGKLDGAENKAPQLLATAQPQPTVRSASSSKPANYTPVSHARREAKPSLANGGPALASVIVVSPPKVTVAKAQPAAKAESVETGAQPAAAPRLKQPGIVSGRGAKPRAEQPKQEAPKKPQLQAGETPAAGARQVVHLEPGS